MIDLNFEVEIEDIKYKISGVWQEGRDGYLEVEEVNQGGWNLSEDSIEDFETIHESFLAEEALKEMECKGIIWIEEPEYV
ncbi:MAG: hypothetical protein GY714_03885 [Desulfobacterales bacterium]|nr:hypothetical protein [Desulfobacterales bacterium]